ARTGYENGPLRYPTTDEGALPDGRGIAQWFQGGAVYWTAATGAHPITAATLRAWGAGGYEQGPLGYPTSSPAALPDGRGTAQWFQGGAVYASPATGAHALPGPLLRAWTDQGAELGSLGYPVGDPVAVPGGGTQLDFQGGALLLAPDGLVSTVAPAAQGSDGTGTVAPAPVANDPVPATGQTPPGSGPAASPAPLPAPPADGTTGATGSGTSDPAPSGDTGAGEDVPAPVPGPATDDGAPAPTAGTPAAGTP
ncbi:LGFP repeat-containing protein, partial [Modestobacter sp. SYSU DS0290]